MCRCGLSCDYIIKTLEYSRGEKVGYGPLVGMFLPEAEIKDSKSSEEIFRPP